MLQSNHSNKRDNKQLEEIFAHHLSDKILVYRIYVYTIYKSKRLIGQAFDLVVETPVKIPEPCIRCLDLLLESANFMTLDSC